MLTLSAGLRNADPDLRPPVGLTHARQRPGRDVEDIAGLLRELLNVVRGRFPPGRGISLDRYGDVRDGHGNDLGHDAEGGVLAEDGEHSQIRTHAGVRQAGKVDEIHERRQVLPGDDELGGAAHRVRNDFVMLDDAVHDDLRQTAKRCDEDDAQNRDRSICGEQEQGLQDGVVAEREGELKAAAAGGGLGDLDGDERVDDRLGHRHRLDRPGQQREVERASHCALLRGWPRRAGSGSSGPSAP